MTQFSAPSDLLVVRPDYSRASDAELLGSADADAFAVIYDRHVARLFSWARAGGRARG